MSLGPTSSGREIIGRGVCLRSPAEHGSGNFPGSSPVGEAARLPIFFSTPSTSHVLLVSFLFFSFPSLNIPCQGITGWFATLFFPARKTPLKPMASLHAASKRTQGPFSFSHLSTNTPLIYATIIWPSLLLSLFTFATIVTTGRYRVHRALAGLKKYATTRNAARHRTPCN